MRTKIDLPEPRFRKLKVVAALRGTSLNNVVRSAVETEIRKAQSEAVRRIKFPLLPSSEPGTLTITNAEIEDLLT